MEKESTANDCPKNDLDIGADSKDEDFCVLTAKRCIIFLFIVITIKIGPLEDALFFFKFVFFYSYVVRLI